MTPKLSPTVLRELSRRLNRAMKKQHALMLEFAAMEVDGDLLAWEVAMKRRIVESFRLVGKLQNACYGTKKKAGKKR